MTSMQKEEEAKSEISLKKKMSASDAVKILFSGVCYSFVHTKE